MSDQMKWFKLWYAALSDDGLLELAPALRWAWAALGAYTKMHGTSGVLKIHPENAFLAATMGVKPSEVLSVIATLPHIFLSSAPVRWPHGHYKPWKCDGEVWGEQAGLKMGSDPHERRGSDPLNEWGTRHGTIFVTWRNWTKFQEDTTQRMRGYASRSKRRGEESSRTGGVDAPPKPPPPPHRPQSSGEFADERERIYQASLARKPKLVPT